MPPSGTRTPSAVAVRRIQSELREWMNAPPDGCCLESCEELLRWVIIMQGPEAAGGRALYEDEVFRIRVSFSDNYPLEPPEIIFLEPSPVHPHIYSNGHVCLDILYTGRDGGWSPALTINKVVMSLRSMLASNQDKRRPDGDEQYCKRTLGRSPKETRWAFHDDTV